MKRAVAVTALVCAATVMGAGVGQADSAKDLTRDKLRTHNAVLKKCAQQSEGAISALDISAIFTLESRWNPNAVSTNGIKGYSQLPKATWDKYSDRAVRGSVEGEACTLARYFGVLHQTMGSKGKREMLITFQQGNVRPASSETMGWLNRFYQYTS